MTTAIGINLASVAYWGSEYPFIDRMKSAGGWGATGATEPVAVDQNDYPTAIPAGADSVYMLVPMDPLSAGTDSTYVLTYTGQATLNFLDADVLSYQPGRIVFQFTSTTSTDVVVGLRNLSPSDPLGDMHVVRSDQVDLFNAGAIFNPPFVAKVKLLQCLRYMDWGSTNNNDPTHWTDRAKLTDRTWSTVKGVPIEVMVQLANETGCDPWLCYHTQATDDDVRQELLLIAKLLTSTSANVHLEYSNEVWNWGFQQSTFAAQQGAALWDVDANHDGKIDPNDPAEHDGADWVKWYGYRSAQIAAIGREVLGNRAAPVLGTQTAWVGLEQYIVQGAARAGLGSVADLFAEYAVTAYFGVNLSSPQNPTDVATIVGWAKAPDDSGKAAAFQALRDHTGLTGQDSGSLKWVRADLAAQGQLATGFGLRLVAYEGGVDLADGHSVFGSDLAVVEAFFAELEADPRMGDCYLEMASCFADAGGTLLNVLTDVDEGFWGTLKTVYDQGSPEWDALVKLEAAARAMPAPIVAPPAPAPAPVAPPPASPAPAPAAPARPPAPAAPSTPAPPAKAKKDTALKKALKKLLALFGLA